MFALAEYDRPDSDSAGVLQRVAEQGVRFDAGLAVRREVVRLVEIEISDLGRRYEGANVKCLGGGDAGLLKVLVGHDNVLALRIFIALHDVTPRHLDALLAAEALVLDARVVLLVQQCLAALNRRIEIHRDGDKTEADGTLPDRSRHGASLLAGPRIDRRAGDGVSS
jgi:hypothetical protein